MPKKVTIAIPTQMYERFKYECQGYGVKTVSAVIESKLRFWEGRWEDDRSRAPRRRG